MQPDLTTRTDCRLCGSGDLEKVVSLAPTPPANELRTARELALEQDRFPLELHFCNNCFHVQLLDVVSPERLFRDYVYVSGTSPVFRKHFSDYAADIINRFGLGPESFAVDIGSNDGTLLRSFAEQGVGQILGIDPALEIANAASEAGIPTLAEFFTPALAERILTEYGAADVVVANNVFAHIDDLESVAEGVQRLLKDRGVLVIEVSYLKAVLENTLFDTIYHEHLDYHAVGPLLAFLERFGLRVIDAKEVDSHGGSLRLTAMKHGTLSDVLPSVRSMLEREQQIGLYEAGTYRAFQQKIDDLGTRLLQLLDELIDQGESIAGFGFPAKATTLMHQFGIDGRYIDFVIDDNPLKQGKYSPGFNVPIVSSEHLRTQLPDNIIILAWNFAESIVSRLDWFVDQGRQIIIPLPELEIVKNK